MTESTIGESLERHLDWLRTLVEARLHHHFKNESEASFEPPPSPARTSAAPLDVLFEGYDADWIGRMVVLLALAPVARPQLLDLFLVDNANLKRGFTEFGGLRGRGHGGFLPTVETALFLAAGEDITRRLGVMKRFRSDQYLFGDGLLQRVESIVGEPAASAPLVLTPTALHRLLWNEDHRPDLQPAFPASRITTELAWDDLVLAPSVMQQILEIRGWIEHQTLIQEGWGLKRFLKSGYRCLFHGPPGTGKTLTASLLGRSLGLEVYRVDLSMTVSKYIGETEKNLASVFEQAENRAWILFFDEADALFGRRTASHSSHDRYANQEVSYLLQRVEDFRGLVILASNLKGNIDEAFVRRFQSMIHFPVPGAGMRKELWRRAFSVGLVLAPETDLDDISERYEVTGGEIVNILRSAAIRAARRGSNRVETTDLMDCIRKEFQKSGRLLDRKLERP